MRRTGPRTPGYARFVLETPDLTAAGIARMAERWLEEDRARADLTGLWSLPPGLRARGSVEAQASGVLSGMSAAVAIARAMGVRARPRKRDGQRVRRGDVVLELEGQARSLLACERTLLNALMHLSGVATATARVVQAADRAGTGTVVAATRKTLPGLRDLEKSAVVHGGGDPHRRDLSSSVLLKSNHLALVDLPTLLARVRSHRKGAHPVIVEVRTAREAAEAVHGGADRLLIDNLTPRQVRTLLRGLERSGLRRKVVVEVSGGITERNVAAYSRAGADVASLGGITHSAPALSFHMVVRPAGPSGRGR